jgi:arylsulfatase
MKRKLLSITISSLIAALFNFIYYALFCAQAIAQDMMPNSVQHSALSVGSKNELPLNERDLEKNLFYRNPGSTPNIVIILADNLGWGELSCYTGAPLRGTYTQRIDYLASEGYRLTNFNVEAECTPSRSALLTGRFAIRSGTTTVPMGERNDGLTQWEITIAELLSSQGYATGHFGKWHLGSNDGRFPNDQGFDEWYGIPRSTDESVWTSSPGYDSSICTSVKVLEGKKGEKTHEVTTYDINERRLIDAEITRRSIDFMNKSIKADKKFFAYIPFTLLHYPTLPNPGFEGKTGNGSWADALAELDYNVGEILDAIKLMGIEDNTILIFCGDNGAEWYRPWRGYAGPFRGTYFTPMEGGLRTPFIIRWPGKIPRGKVSNEIIHEVDIFPTIAEIVGTGIPKDRAIDGISQLDFFIGKKDKSNREFFPIYVSDRIEAVKFRNFKVFFYDHSEGPDPPLKRNTPRIVNLYLDPTETDDHTEVSTWIQVPASKYLLEFMMSLNRYPPIKPGTPDPYTPPY